MRLFVCLLSLALCFTLGVLAAGIDGKWVAEQKQRTQDGGERTVNITLELKAAGGALTGTVSQPARGGEDRKTEIKDGKLEGDKFSFTTVTTNQRGEMKFTWTGVVKGDTLEGTRAREGGQGRAQPFTAKRQ
jgi:uncharacterized protein (DUF58 family)